MQEDGHGIGLVGKVAAVVSPRELAVNLGSNDGVYLNSLAIVYKEIQVKDPESGEVLGSVERPLLRLKITEVQERMSVAQTIDLLPQSEAEGAWTMGRSLRFRKISSSRVDSSPDAVFVDVGDEIVVFPGDEVAD